jgi:hypothetical protein
LWTIRNPVGHDTGGPPPTISGTYVPDTLPYVLPPAANQPGCTQCIDAGLSDISGTPIFRDGRVYAAWETAVDNGTQVVPGIEYAQVEVAKTSAKSSYYYFSGDTAATYPAVMPGRDGKIAMVYDLMNARVNPQTRYIVANIDAARFVGPGHLLKAGEAPYRPGVCGTTDLPVCRWGDYSAASIDQAGTVWLAGQYANRSVTPDNGRNWGTWIGALTTST